MARTCNKKDVHQTRSMLLVSRKVISATSAHTDMQLEFRTLLGMKMQNKKKARMDDRASLGLSVQVQEIVGRIQHATKRSSSASWPLSCIPAVADGLYAISLLVPAPNSDIWGVGASLFAAPPVFPVFRDSHCRLSQDPT